MPDTDIRRDRSVELADEVRRMAAAGMSAGQPEVSRRRGISWRSVLVGVFLLAIVLLAVLPPLVNVNRFKRRIVASIGASLGRPVHLDSVSLVLLPFPGFKLDNFVVAEDPAFGAEPVIHANSVVATLRFSSLWRRKVEFSKISLDEPSINLVHTAEGKWNVEGILLQAARIPAAPTAQATAGAEPRFPYIEATGARVNVKAGVEKLPFSLTEADFALWLPDPQQWRIRIVAKPTRTDTDSSDTGTVSLEGSLGRAERLDLIPLDLSGEWKNVPLGEASRVVAGRDVGLRGDLKVNVRVHGTVGGSVITSIVDLRGVRRAEFVPEHPIDLHAECVATAAETFHAFHEIRCSWPPPLAPTLVAVTGDIPDIHDPGSASFEVGTPGLPASVLLNWLRVASNRVPPDVTAAGTIAGSVSSASGGWSGKLEATGAEVANGPVGETSVKLGDVTIATLPGASLGIRPIRKVQNRLKGAPALNVIAPEGFLMTPTTVALGGKEPALLDGRFDLDGYSLHLSGSVLPSRLLALGAAIPQFGDGLRAVLPPTEPRTEPTKGVAPHVELPIHVDLTSSRTWAGGQTWSKIAVAAMAKPAHRRRR